MNTLNEIREGLKKIADAHLQINSFGFGDIWEFNSSGVTNMPCFFVELDSVTRVRRQTNYKFNGWILGSVLNGESDELEVLSNMILTAQDIIFEMTHPDWTWTFLEQKEPITMEDFTEKTDEYLTGVKFTFTIALDIPRDRCAIPETAITRI